MSQVDLYILKGKSLITISVALILISCGINMYSVYEKQENNNYTITYENINIKDMATANITTKKEVEKANPIIQVINNYQKMTSVEAPKEILLPSKNDSIAENIENRRIWYLPCEMGTISNGLTYSHYALDITSPRGTSEAIYPIANGKISGIYTDSAGAKIVTVNHNINGTNYTSQYVHLSSYAPDLYIGKEVTINDYLGYMGRTGIATGTHLHLAVVDCAIFDKNDSNCADLGRFFNYGIRRLNQGFYGLQSVMSVPSSWTSR